MAVATETQGQEVSFLSSAVEEGVRQHLGFTDEEQIGFAQLDSITTLDLSNRGITDVRDLIMIPKLRMLNLSDNGVEDLQPLAVLDSLEWVDLSYNGLKDINDLHHSSARNLTINVAFNHIRDFSLFGCFSMCHFILEGTGLQLNDHPLYFDVYDFYADVDDEDVPLVCYRGITNMEANATFECGSLHVPASMDGYTNSVILGDNLNMTTKAILSNDERGDTTWVVPPMTYEVMSGGEVTIDTELPETYEIGYLRALHGETTADGTTLHYVAPTPAVADTLYLSYYEDERVKGFTQLYITSQQSPTEVKGVAQEPSLRMSLQSHSLHITGTQAQWEDVKAVKVYDAIGRLLAVETPDNNHDMVVHLPAKHPVVIVEVTFTKRCTVTKVAIK